MMDYADTIRRVLENVRDPYSQTLAPGARAALAALAALLVENSRLNVSEAAWAAQALEAEAERQQAQEERDGAIRALKMASTVLESTREQRQLAVDALREADALLAPGPKLGQRQRAAQVIRAALVKLGVDI